MLSKMAYVCTYIRFQLENLNVRGFACMCVYLGTEKLVTWDWNLKIQYNESPFHSNDRDLYYVELLNLWLDLRRMNGLKPP